MSTILTQSEEAAYPDRPLVGGIGMLASMSVGDEGSFITHDLGMPHAVLHVRFTMNRADVVGGRIVLLACTDNQGSEVIRVSYDSTDRLLSVWTQLGGQVSCTLDDTIAWQCIEVAVDSNNDRHELWINGVLADEAASGIAGIAVQTCLFGVIQKQSAVTGDLYLDEFCIADGYIGPVTVSADSPYADDPARWLVVYNKGIAGGPEWAESYRQARSIPYANLLGLNEPSQETLTTSYFTELATSITNYLVQTGLDGQVMGVLIGYGIPGYVDFLGNGELEATPGLLQNDSTTHGTLSNPNGVGTLGERLTFDDLAGVRMTARIDGLDGPTATQIIDRATQVMDGVLHADDSIIYFDPFVGTEPAYQQTFSDMLDWATGVDGLRTRLPILLSGDPAGNDDAEFTDVSSDGFFWGWASIQTQPFIFNDPSGRRVVSAQMHLEAPTATSLRQHERDNWIDVPIAQGYASAIASCRVNPVSVIPDAGRFFDALRSGWTLAEAWHVAQPMLRSGFYLVGDPLMTVIMPKSGYALYGPLDSLTDLDPESPSLVAGDNNQQVDVSGNLPTEGVAKRYLLRRTDDLGRFESSTMSIGVFNLGGVLYPAMCRPVWPDVEGWPVTVEDEHLILEVYWSCVISAANIKTIELAQQPIGASWEVASDAQWAATDRRVRVTLPMPTVQTRYLWLLTSGHGETIFTAMSDWVDPAVRPTAVLNILGA